jgi:hypothetical protein
MDGGETHRQERTFGRGRTQPGNGRRDDWLSHLQPEAGKHWFSYLRLENTGSNIQKNVILVSNAPCIGNIHCVCVCVFAMCVCGRACVRVRACVRGTTPNAGGACRLSLVSTRIYNGKLLQLLLVLLIITVARLAS